MIPTYGAASFISFSLNPRAKIEVKNSLNIQTNMVNIEIKVKNLIKIDTVKIDLYRDLINEGIKTWVKAPSANILRNRFGNLNATKKISEYMLAPKVEAIKRSRIKPKILETSIPKLFVKNFLIKCKI